MTWDVEYTLEFEAWWNGLDDEAQGSIDAHVRMLEVQGPNLGYPYTSGVNDSRHGHMRELRVQSKGRPIRIFYAFDPRRSAILLIGGDKTGNQRFYEEMIPVADRLYDEHLVEIEREARRR